MPAYNTTTLLPAGTTGNQTSPANTPQPDEADYIAFRLVCEAIGATPAITWQIQASLDDKNVADNLSIWDNIGYITEASDTVAFTSRSGPIVAGTAQTNFPSSRQRGYRKYRVVITGNVNVTYRVEMFGLDVD